MILPVHWEERAIEDRASIFDQIAIDRPIAATRMDHRFREECMVLGVFPHLGREGRAANTREFAIAQTPYVVIYAIESASIRILRILHGAREWPSRAT